MNKYTLLLLGAISASLSSSAQTDNGKVAYKIYDNFDTHETYAWEPYPYQQDTGYDPTFTVKREPAYGKKGSSLFRTVRPNEASDLTAGFTKRINLFTTKSTRVKFVFFMMGDRTAANLQVSLGSFDGKLYTHTIAAPEPNTWVEVDLPIESFTANGKTLSASEHLQVIVVKGYYTKVSHLLSYNLFMDEFSINGERDRQFVAKSPQSTWFEHFEQATLNRQYAPGETLSLAVEAEDGAKVKEVTADLITPDNKVLTKGIRFYDDGSHGDNKASDGIWTNNAAYTFKSADQRGQWKARFTGMSGSQKVASELRFIVPASPMKTSDHPRVFITPKELAERKAGNESPVAKKLLDNFINSYKPTTVDITKLEAPDYSPIESLTGGPYARTVPRTWYATQNALAKVVNTEAWEYSLRGNKEAGTKAIAALLKLCELPSWNHPWMEANGNHMYFPGNPAVMAAGLGYDLLYPMMTEDQRKAVRRGIMDNAIKPFYRDMVVLNRMPSSNSNHIAVILSGVGIAAVAIANDDPELPGLEPYMSGILAKTKQLIDRSLLADGSYNEPYTYQQMAYRELVEALYTFEKNLGVDYTSTTYLKEFYRYGLYVTQSNGRYQDLGDVSPVYGFDQQPSQWLVHKLKDPYMYKYVKKAWDSGKAPGGILPYVWYTEGITPIGRETLPTSKLFEGKGHMVMRSNWDDNGSILIFKAGPNGNHYHYDQGTILLTHNGEELLSDAGHSSNYYENLYYPGYYIQSIGHNVMLVDKNAESQMPGDYENGIASLRNYPKVVSSFAGESNDAVEGDLTSVYRGEVSSYTRTILSEKGGLMFLFDQVKSSKPHSYNWLFHAEHTNGKSSIAYDDSRVTITRPAARLTMDIVSPGKLTGEIKNSDRAESFITLSSEKINDAAFLAVMLPEGKAKDKELAAAPKAERIEARGWVGAQVKNDTGLHYGLFKTEDTADENIQGFRTDALRFTSILKNNKVTQAYFEGTNFEGYGLKINTSAKSTVSFNMKDGRNVLEIKSAMPSKITISASAKPSRILMNGKTFKNFEYDSKGKTLSINLPEGQSTVNIQ